MAYNRNYNENSNNVSVLFEHVFFEEQTEQSSRRFMIRVLEFNDTHNLSVGFSRQWLAPNGEWVAAKKGHAYFSIAVWNQLKAQFGAVSDQIEAFFANGNGAGRMGPAPQGSNVGGSYAPNANTVSGGNGDEDVIMPIAAPTQPPSSRLRKRTRHRQSSPTARTTSIAAAVAMSTVAEAPSELTASVSKLAKLTSSPNDRLDEESMKTVLEIVLNNMMKHNLICSMEVDAMNGTDTHIVLSARELWHQMLQRTIIDRVRNEVVKRKLLPVTIHTLCALLTDVANSFA